MATVDQHDNAMIRLNAIMRNDDPDDLGMLSDIGYEILRVYDETASYIRRTEKPFVGKVAVTFSFAGVKTENEAEITVTMGEIRTTVPPKTLPRKRRTFAGRDGGISTVPTQIELPIMGIKGAVDGGMQDKPGMKEVKLV